MEERRKGQGIFHRFILRKKLSFFTSLACPLFYAFFFSLTRYFIGYSCPFSVGYLMTLFSIEIIYRWMIMMIDFFERILKEA
jgi:hypothetical protein